MAYVEGLTKERMLAIEAASVVDGEVVGDNLVLTKHDGSTINAGDVRGPQGDPGTNAVNQIVAHAIGEVFFWAGTLINVPVGCLIADGSAISRTTYSQLFAQMGTTHGAGDGSTTFNLPNMLGKVPVGYDATQTEFNALGKIGGAKTHTLSAAEIPAHSHAITHGVGGSAMAVTQTSVGDGAASNRWHLADGVAGLVTSVVGSTGSHNNLQPYIAGLWIVKAFYTSAEIDPNVTTHAHAIADVTGLPAVVTSVGLTEKVKAQVFSTSAQLIAGVATTALTMTGSMAAGSSILNVMGFAYNANSGALRQLTLELLRDGVVVGGPIKIAIPTDATLGGPGYGFASSVPLTDTAGNHTYTLRGAAGVNSAVGISNTRMWVTQYI